MIFIGRFVNLLGSDSLPHNGVVSEYFSKRNKLRVRCTVLLIVSSSLQTSVLLLLLQGEMILDGLIVFGILAFLGNATNSYLIFRRILC